MINSAQRKASGTFEDGAEALAFLLSTGTALVGWLLGVAAMALGLPFAIWHLAVGIFAMGFALHVPVVWRLLRRRGLSRARVLLFHHHYAWKWLYRIGPLREAKSILQTQHRQSWEEFLEGWHLQISIALGSLVAGAGLSWLMFALTT